MKTFTNKLALASGLVLALVAILLLFGKPVYAESSQSVAATVEANDETVSALLYMREEEKLAQDVYITLYDLWGMQVFNNISRAESQHMSAVLELLAVRGIEDPVVGNGLGEFTDPDLQSLYTALVAKGSQSKTDALIVGATIEDVDIFDLQAALATTTEADVQEVFQNLLRGSENHMRAFVRNLERSGETYEPQYISAATYDSIIASTNTSTNSMGSRNSRLSRGRQSNEESTGNWGRSGRNR
jgi:hypothetical protein